jgi:alkanesulfonate monooxygenase SsuD/methylene tetrahydromethanopterin reductase-like flavin-dependent oxidoreductase (luciferase family)
MKIRMGAMVLPSIGATSAQIEQGFAGQNPIYYQNTLRDIGRLVQQLEDLGFDFVAFTEHHFHVEGLEVSNNPVMLGTWAAGITKRIRLGQMGIVLPSRNPILLAEDLAMLDHFSEGRMMAGFARGYQSRHVATIGQNLNAHSTTPTDPDFAEHDRINRELFDEHYTIIRKAWDQSLFSHQGDHWKVPPDGIVWDHPATMHMAPGMVGDDGMLKQVGIAPQTLQEPSEIEVFTPFTMSEQTLTWAAQENVKPVVFTPIEEIAKGCVDLYHEASLAAGRKSEWGRGVGHFRDIVVADTDEEAIEIAANGMGYIWNRWHDWFGFNEALRYPGETGAIPNTPETIRDRGYALCGSVDTVARMIETLLKTYNTDLLVPWIAAGPAPLDKLLKSNELLVEKVLPKIGVELEQFKPVLRKEFQGDTWQNRRI